MKLSKHCYLISGLAVEPPWAVNAGFIVGRHTTMIVDTGSNRLSAQTIFGYAVCAKPDNKLMVANTEPHFDHMGGNGFFLGRNIDVYAHSGVERKYEAFLQNKEDFNNTIPNAVRRGRREADVFFYGTELANPNRVLSPGETVDLGEIGVTALSTPGHTPQNISLFVASEGVLYCGDCVVTGYLPNLEAGGVPDWERWLASLEVLEKLGPETIVPGHGYTVTGHVQIGIELDNMKTIIRKAIEDKSAPTQKP